MLGGHLISTLAFGVPVSVMMAILLGAFFIQGLVPGPDMLIPEPKGHLNLTFSFVWTIVISNVITVAVCFLFLRQLVRITYVRASLLIPFILLLIYLGAFTEKNAFADMVLVFVFGLLGWVMERVEWPRPPLILGLVLGPLAENRLFLSIDNYGIAWLGRPLVLFLIGLTLAGAFYPAVKAIWKRRYQGKVGAPAGVAAPVLRNGAGERQRRFALSGGALFSLAVVIVMIFALLYSRRFNPRAGLFPWAIGFPLLGFASLEAVLELTGRKGRKGALARAEAGGAPPKVEAPGQTLAMFCWIASYLFAIWLVGFSLGVPLCAFVQLKFGSKEKWWLSAVLALCAWLFLYGIFGLALQVPFPEGQLFSWLDLFPE